MTKSVSELLAKARLQVGRGNLILASQALIEAIEILESKSCDPASCVCKTGKLTGDITLTGNLNVEGVVQSGNRPTDTSAEVVKAIQASPERKVFYIHSRDYKEVAKVKDLVTTETSEVEMKPKRSRPPKDPK